jgi:replicative DNA helicase
MNLILCKVLQEQDLNIWSKLKRDYFEPPYTLVYDLISNFYETYGKIPSFSELEIVTRSERDLNTIRAIKTIQVPEDLDTNIIFQATVNEYAQNEVLSKLYTYLEELPFKETAEIIEDLASIAINIEEKTESAEQIVLMNDFSIVDENELANRVYLGINNAFDSHSLGVAPTELIMFGGFRGSGKSIVCSNLVCNQYIQDKPSLYFSIEMRGREVFQRNLAILSEVGLQKIKSGKLDRKSVV